MPPPLVSLCLIARDEEAVLPRCLRSCDRFVDEIVVVDTGSADETPRIAARFGARLIHRDWNDHFGEARNAALEAATGRFVLVLDADEWVESTEDPDLLRRLVTSTEEEAFTIDLVDRLDSGSMRRYPLVRLFRNRPEYRYSGSFHEQITPAIARRSELDAVSARPSGLVVGHDGYLVSARTNREKARRNLELLRRRVGADPDDAAGRYFLAREEVPVRAGRAVPGAHLRNALDQLEWLAARPSALSEPLRVDAERLHAAALLASERPRDAIEVLQRCEDRGVACELLRADAESILAADNDERERALERVERCFDRETRDRGPFSEPSLSGAIARTRAAELLLSLERLDEAATMATEAARMPGGGAAPGIALAAVARSRGEGVEALRHYIETIRIDPLDPWVWAGMGEVLLEQRLPAEAVEPLHNAARLAPGWNRADEALAAALLLSDRETELIEWIGVGEDDARGAGRRAGVILARALTGANPPEGEPDAEVLRSIERILTRLATARRVDLLRRLEDSLACMTHGGSS